MFVQAELSDVVEPAESRVLEIEIGASVSAQSPVSGELSRRKSAACVSRNDQQKMINRG